MKSFFAPYVLTQSDSLEFKLLKNCLIEVDENGIIQQVHENQKSSKDCTVLSNLIMPGLTNAHSHAFQISMRGYADNPANFQDWVNTYLYPSIEKLDENSLRIIYKNFFKSLLRNGITTLGEFHYFHHDKSSDNKLDTLFLEEAQLSGIRLSLLYSAYDKGTRKAQKRFHHSIDSFLKALDVIESWISVNKLENDWSLSVAPHSLHGCSDELLRESVSWALKNKRYWHIHLAEQKSDIDYSNTHYGKSPLFALETILKGNLNKYTSLVHAVWLDEKEIDLFKEKELNLIYNPFTNMYLGDGITKTAQMDFGKSSYVALGTDSNNAFNMFTEAKIFESLQRVSYLEMGVIDSNILLSSITSFGGKLLNLPVGKIDTEFFADFIEVDLSRCQINVDLDSIEPSILINHLIFSGVDAQAIRSVFIGGKKLDT